LPLVTMPEGNGSGSVEVLSRFLGLTKTRKSRPVNARFGLIFKENL